MIYTSISLWTFLSAMSGSDNEWPRTTSLNFNRDSEKINDFQSFFKGFFNAFADFFAVLKMYCTVSKKSISRYFSVTSIHGERGLLAA